MKLFSKITIAIFFITLLITIVQFPNLPEEVPSHYNIMGEADAWSNKWFIFFLPLLGMGLWLMFGQIEKYPEFINMPNGGESLNEGQRQNSIMMISTLRNQVLLFMSLLTLKEVLTSIGYSIQLGIWEFVIFVAVLTLTMVFYIVKNYKLKII